MKRLPDRVRDVRDEVEHEPQPQPQTPADERSHDHERVHVPSGLSHLRILAHPSNPRERARPERGTHHRSRTGAPPMPEPTDDKGTDDKGTEGAPPNGNSAPGTGPADDDKGTKDAPPNGDRAPGRPKDDDADWKARARQHEDTSKARKKDLDTALAERDGLKGVLDSLRKALDPDGAGKDADPAELAKVAAQERDQARAEVKLAKVELAAERAARRAGADVEALLDSRTFLKRLGDLDPTDDGFAAAVETAVRDAVKERPSLKSGTPPPPKSGNADMTGGGTPGSGQLTRADLKNMSPKDIEKARSDGRLKTLLGG